MKQGAQARKVVSVDRKEFGPWDNFAAHAAKLKKLGATEADLEPLRKAAAAIEQAEREEAAEAAQERDLGVITSPLETPWGWVIAPPTKAARRWAQAAMLAVTGGIAADTPVGQVNAVLAGLWALREWGVGHKDAVARAVSSSGGLAEFIFDVVDEVSKSVGGVDKALAASIQILAQLMGITKRAVEEAAKKERAADLDRIARRIAARLVTGKSSGKA